MGLYSEGLIYGGKFAFQIDWASLIVGSKFTDLALFYFVFEGNFPSTSPRGDYIQRGDLTEGFLRYRFGRAYFRNFTVFCKQNEYFSRFEFLVRLELRSASASIQPV